MFLSQKIHFLMKELIDLLWGLLVYRQMVLIGPRTVTHLGDLRSLWMILWRCK